MEAIDPPEDFLLQLVRLELDFLKKAKERSFLDDKIPLLTYLYSESSIGLNIFFHMSCPYAAFQLRIKPTGIIAAIHRLMACISKVEEYDPQTRQRKKVFELESFAKFFEVMKSKLAISSPKTESLSKFEDLNLEFDEYPSKILSFLNQQLQFELKNLNQLTKDEIPSHLGKQNLAADKKLHNKLTSTQSQSHEMYSLDSEVGSSERIQVSYLNQKPAETESHSGSGSKPSGTQQMSLNSTEHYLSPIKSEDQSDSRFDSAGKSPTQVRTFSLNSTLLPKLEKYRPPQPVAKQPTSPITTAPSILFFDYEPAFMLGDLSKLVSSSLKWKPSGVVSKTSGLIATETELKKLLNSFKVAHLQNPVQFEQHFSKSHKGLLGAFNFLQRLEMLVSLANQEKANGFLHLVSQFKSLAPPGAKEQGLFTGTGVLYSSALELFSQFGRLVLWDQICPYDYPQTLSIFLTFLPTCSRITVARILERLLYIVQYFSDDLEDQLDNHLEELLKEDSKMKSERWFFLAQITIHQLKNPNLKPKKAENRKQLPTFLMAYLNSAGSFYLSGSKHGDYLQEFVFCCSSVEELLGSAEVNAVYSVMFNLIQTITLGNQVVQSNYRMLVTDLLNEAQSSAQFRIAGIKYLAGSVADFKQLLQVNQHGLSCQVCLSLLGPLIDTLNSAEMDHFRETPDELLPSWCAMQDLETRFNRTTPPKLLSEVQGRLVELYKRILRHCGTLEFLETRLQHREYYLKFFNDAAKYSNAFKAEYKPNELEKAFDELVEIDAKKETINSIRVTLQSLEQKNFIQLPKKSSKLGVWIELENSISFDKLLAIHQEVSCTSKATIKAAKLMETEFYKKQLQAKQISAKQDLKSFEKACQEIEDLIRNQVKESLTEIDQNKFELLDSLFQDAEISKEISEVLGLQNDIKIAQVRYQMYKLCKDWKDCKTKLKQVMKYFLVSQDEDLICEVDKLVNSAYGSQKLSLSMPSIGKIIAQVLKGSVQPLSQPESLIAVLVADTILAENLGNITKIHQHFVEKEGTHYQQILFSSELPKTGLSSQHIHELEKFMANCAKFKQRGSKPALSRFVDFLKLCSVKVSTTSTNSTDSSFSEVFLVAEHLIRVSRTLNESVAKGSDRMEDILKRSETRFKYDQISNGYEVAACLNPKISHQSAKSKSATIHLTEDLVYLSEMETIQNQAIIRESSEANHLATKHETIAASSQCTKYGRFVRLVEAIKSIRDSLNAIMALGLVFNLEGKIKKEFEKSKRSGRPKRVDDADMDNSNNSNNEHSSVEDTFDFSQISSNITYNGFNLFLKLESNNSENPQISHFLALQQILTEVLKQCKMHLIREGVKFHQITRLAGAQKILLCQHLLQVQKQPKVGEGLSSQVANNLFRFATQRLTITMSAMSAFSTRPDMLMTTEILEAFFSAAGLTNKGMTESTFEISESQLGHEIVGSQIQYYLTEPDKTLSDLAKLMLLNKGRTSNYKDHPSRFFFVKENHNAEQILEFLVSAAQDPAEPFYYMVDLHLLKQEVSQSLLPMIKEVFCSKAKRTCNNHLFLLIERSNAGSQYLLDEWRKNPEYLCEFASGQGTTIDLASINDFQKSTGLKIFTSGMPGSGKSLRITRLAEASNKELVTLNFCADMSQAGIQQRLTILQDALQTKTDKALHIKLDMIENFHQNHQLIDRLLFQILFLRCIPFKDSYLFLDDLEHVYVEVQHTAKEKYFKHLSTFNFFRNRLKKPQKQATEMVLVDFVHEHIPKIVSTEVYSDLIESSFFEEESRFGLPYRLCILFLMRSPELFASFNPKQPNSSAFSSEFFMIEFFEFLKNEKRETYSNKFIEVLFENLKQKKKIETSLSQIVNFFDLLYHQIITFLEVAIFAYSKAGDGQTAEPELYQLRLRIVQSIIQDCLDQIWSVGNNIIKADQLTERIILAQNAEWQVEEDLKELQNLQTTIDKQMPIDHFGSLPNLCRLKQVDKSKLKLSEFKEGVKSEQIVQLVGNDTEQSLLQALIQHLKISTTVDQLKTKLKDYQGGKGFHLTSGIFDKILLICQKAELDLPIVIMGPTGCGKTYLINFIAECLLSVEIVVINLHPGVSAEDLQKQLLQIYSKSCILQKQAEKEGRAPQKLWVMFDEFNTSSLQYLVAEIMLTRKSNFAAELSNKVFSSDIVFVACCNPYKLKKQESKQTGLRNSAASSLLSHRVYPVPSSLSLFISKFEAVQGEEEKRHIQTVIDKLNLTTLRIVRSEDIATLKTMLRETVRACHEHFREIGSENSVSLRDMSRFFELFQFFTKLFNLSMGEDNEPSYFELFDGLVTATQLCYLLRLESRDERFAFREKLQNTVANSKFKYEERFEVVLAKFAEEIKNDLKIPLDNAALNRPLKENLLALWVCIINKIPLLICGKPGTSKTLAIQIIEKIFSQPRKLNSADTELTGQVGLREYVQDFENQNEYSYFFNNTIQYKFNKFWGTETTTAESVEAAFTKTKNSAGFSGQTNSSVGVNLIFDEIGLAEISKDNPLKVLHSWLELKERTFGFIGLSNWQLDASKMNRVLYLARLDMNTGELTDTCKTRFERTSQFKQLLPYLEALASAYVGFREKELSSLSGHRNLHGSRDFYSVISILSQSLGLLKIKSTSSEASESNDDLISLTNSELTYLLMQNAIERSFCPKQVDGSSHWSMLELYNSNLTSNHKGGFSKTEFPSASNFEMIYQNLLDPQARHLVVFTSTAGIEDTIVEKIRNFQLEVKKLEPTKFVYLAQKQGREEMIKLIMTQLPVYTAGGYTVVMKDIRDVYGCLYDLLNKSYFRDTAKGKNKCKLFYEGHEEIVDVDDNFRIILLLEQVNPNLTQDDLEKLLPAPFLNRFEKYCIAVDDLMSPVEKAAYTNLKTIFETESTKPAISPYCYIHNYSDELIRSAVKQTIEVDSFEFKTEHSNLTNYLMERIRKSCQSKNTPRQHSRTKSTKSMNEPTETELLEGALRRLYPLLSRNLILFLQLNFKGTPELLEDLVNEFEEYHNYDSLADLANTMMRGSTNQTKSVVFTYTSAEQLKEMLLMTKQLPTNSQNMAAHELMDAVQLHKQTFGQGERLRKLIQNPNKLLVVSFSRMSDWPLMQHLRYMIKITPGQENKRVIFVAHYGDKDIRKCQDGNLKIPCAVSFFTKDWTMHAIDDLKASNYADCINMSKVEIVDWVRADYTILFGTDKSKYLMEIAKQKIKQMVFKPWGNTSLSGEETLKIYDMICGLDWIMESIVAAFVNRLESPSEEDERDWKKLSHRDLLRAQTNSSAIGLFDSENDMFINLAKRYRDHISKYMDKLKPLETVRRAIPMLSQAIAIPSIGQREILADIDNDIVTVERNELEAEIQNILEAKNLLSTLDLQVDSLKKLVRDQYTNSSTDYITKFDSAFRTALQAPDLEPLTNFRWGNSKNERLPVAMPMLIAKKVLDCYSSRVEFRLSSFKLKQVVILTGYTLLERLKLSEGYAELSIAALLILETFSEELQIISVSLESMGTHRLEKESAMLADSFTSKRLFDVMQYTKQIFQLQTITCDEHLKQVCTDLEMGVRLSKMLPKLFQSAQEKLEKTLLHRELYLDVLKWMGNFKEEPQRRQVRQIHNQVLTEVSTDLLSKIVIGLLTAFVKAGTSGRADLKRCQELIDEHLGQLYSMLSDKTKEEGFSTLVSLIAERVLSSRNSTWQDAVQVDGAIIIMAKTVLRSWPNHQISTKLLQLVQELVKNSSTVDEESKSQITERFNFQLINSTEEINLLIGGATEAEGFLSDGVKVVKELVKSTQESTVLNRQQVISLRQLKKFLTTWRDQDPNIQQDKKSQFQSATLRLLETDPNCGLLLTHLVCAFFGSTAAMRRVGLHEISVHIDQHFKLEIEPLQLLDLDTPPDSKVPAPAQPQETFNSQFELINTEMFKKGNPGAISTRLTKNLSSRIEFARTGFLNASNSEKTVRLLLLVATNLVQYAPESFVYSLKKFEAKSFTPLIEPQSRRNKQTLRALYFKENPERGSTDLVEQGKWLMIYRCTDPDCGQLLVSGHSDPTSWFGRHKTVKGCPGPCKRVYGQNPMSHSESKHLQEITLDQMQQERGQILSQESKSKVYTPETAHSQLLQSLDFDVTWILQLYQDLTDYRTATFASILQHLFCLVYVSSQIPFKDSEMQADTIVKMLSRVIKKSEVHLLHCMTIFLICLQKDLTVKEISDPDQLRQYLQDVLSTKLSNFDKALHQYEKLAHSKRGKTEDSELLQKNYIYGLLDPTQLTKMFSNSRIPSLTWWLAPLEPSTVANLKASLRKHRGQECIQTKFILDVMDKRELLNHLRPLLSTLKEMTSLFSNNYNQRFSYEESIVMMDGVQNQLINDEEEMMVTPNQRIHKLTLGSLLDLNYFGKTVKEQNRTSLRQTDLKQTPRNNTDPSDLARQFQQKFKPALEKHLNVLLEQIPDQIQYLLTTVVPKMTTNVCTTEISTQEQVIRIMETLSNLSNPKKSSFIAYVIPDTSRMSNQKFEAALFSMEALIRALLQAQEQFISKYVDRPEFSKFSIYRTKHSRSFFECKDEYFMAPEFDIEQDLKQTACFEFGMGYQAPELKIQVSLLARKWYETLLSETTKISLEPNYSFSGQSNKKNLFQISRYLSQELKISMESNWQEISFVDKYANSQGSELESTLTVLLNYMLQHHRHELMTESSLMEFLPADLRCLAPSALLVEMKLKHVELVRQQILLGMHKETFKILEKNQECSNLMKDLNDADKDSVPKLKPLKKIFGELETSKQAERLRTIIQEVKVFVGTIINHESLQPQPENPNRLQCLDYLDTSIHTLARDFECEDLLKPVASLFSSKHKVYLGHLIYILKFDLARELHSLEVRLQDSEEES